MTTNETQQKAQSIINSMTETHHRPNTVNHGLLINLPERPQILRKLLIGALGFPEDKEIRTEIKTFAYDLFNSEDYASIMQNEASKMESVDVIDQNKSGNLSINIAVTLWKNKN
tara:strand:+ start:190 stop:531 length:342 start_codon:yes stop_codon:yes gene_type:complete